MIGAIPVVADNRIREAMARGEFDGLEGASRPLADIDGGYDPDWWIKKKIERERLDAEQVVALMKRLRRV